LKQSAKGLVFPCVIDIKVFMRSKSSNIELTTNLLLQSIATENFHGISEKFSRSGKFHSLSCRVKAKDKAQMDELFSLLSSHPEILMVV